MEKILRYLPTRTKNKIIKSFKDMNDYTLVSVNIENKTIKYTHNVCGVTTEKTIAAFHQNNRCGNKKCINDRRKQTNFKKYGVDYCIQNEEIKAKMVQTNIEKYGVVNPSENKIVKEKRIDTFIKKYGIKNPSQVDEFKAKRRDTFIKKYGVDNPLKSQNVKDKLKDTCLRKYGVCNPSQIQEVKDKKLHKILNKMSIKLVNTLIENGYELLEDYEGIFHKNRHKDVHKRYKIKHLECGNIFQDDVFALPRCPKCFPQTMSIKEQYWGDYIEYMGYKVIRNDRTVIKPKEIDIYLPELKIGFEYNGIYWHSSMFKSETYHEDKVKQAKEKGVELYHLWESYSDKEIENIINNALLDN